MRKFTLNSSVEFEVEEEIIIDTSSFKEAMESGGIKIANIDVTLINPGGDTYENEKDIQTIKDAIIYGLIEKG